MATWINFKELRDELSFEAVLRHYGVELKLKGDQHMGFCPLPGHQGKRNSPSFSANMEKKVFHCFGCQAKGNILEFAALMEKEPLDNGAALRKVCIRLRDRFCPVGHGKKKEKRPTEEAELPLGASASRAIANLPLDFELRTLDRQHPYLRGRGFAVETIAHFGLGYCSRGLLAGRAAIPLHDRLGQLVGYAGRVVDDKTITEENPRYRLPSKRERDGQWHEFKKSLFLYNGHRVPGRRQDLVVVEGFPSVWWLTQHGFPSVVATMGSECSEEQAELIVSHVDPDGHVWVMPDGDKAGFGFAQSVLRQVAPHRFVRWIRLENGKQPTDLSVQELKACLP